MRPATLLKLSGELGGTWPVAVGHAAECRRRFSMQDVRDFAAVSGDANPIHVDEQAGKASRFGRNIVHGWLTASLFGSIFATALPGAVYLSQSVDFVQPVFIDDEVHARVEVSMVTPRGRGFQAKCATTCSVFRDGKTIQVISGEGVVLLPANRPGTTAKL